MQANLDTSASDGQPHTVPRPLWHERRRQAIGEPTILRASAWPYPPRVPHMISGHPFVIGALACLAVTEVPPSTRVQYGIDARQSRLVVETRTDGVTSIFAHDHRIEARGITGSMTFTPNFPDTAALEVKVRADSLRLTDAGVADKNQRKIEAWIRRALGTDRYGEILFRSTRISAEPLGDRLFEVQISGELLLHGRRKPVTVPAQVFLRADMVRAKGSLRLRQTDFGITPASLVDGTVTAQDEVTLTFDIVCLRR